MGLWYFHVIETRLQGLSTFRPGRLFKKSSLNEWLTNIINELYYYVNVFRPAYGIALGPQRTMKLP